MSTETITEIKKDRPALYVGTYAKYNNGSIAGKWLYLDDYEDAASFLAACKELHKDESDPELMYQDFEHFPEVFYDESMGTVELEKLYGYIKLDANDRELINEYVEATGYSIEDINLDKAKDAHYCTLTRDFGMDSYNKAMGNYVVDEGLLEVPDHLNGYINYESLGRDWLMDMSVSANGWVFTNS